MRKKIAGDVASSLYFFQSLLGGYPYAQLNVIETPSRTSSGFPGILFLTSLTFSQELEGVMESLRGHEVSHQWWGNLVGWESYHDQWLSEGLAEYCGAIMNQFLLDGDKRFFQALEGWRNDLLEKGHIGVSVGLRRFGFSKSDLIRSDGLDAGPIWLGIRLGEKYSIDYYLNVYEKGAYVVHMLRTLLHDFETGSDERFWNLLADFVQTYKGQKADSEDFKRIVDKHFGQDMTWFFEQWIYGMEIPTYVYAYEIASAKNAYFVDLHIEQQDVPSEFKAFIPISVEAPNKEKITRLILMTGSEKSLRLGPFSSRPQRVIFNDFAGVLARVKSR